MVIVVTENRKKLLFYSSKPLFAVVEFIKHRYFFEEMLVLTSY